MNRNQLLAMMAMLVMSCLIFAQGPARDPKTGKFIKKTTMTGKMSKSKMSKSAFNAAHPRDPKTGKFIKKSTMGSKMTGMHSMHMMKAHKPMMGKMTSHMKTTPVLKKPGMFSKLKGMMSKKKKMVKKS